MRQRFLKRLSWAGWDQYQDLYAERNAISSRLTLDTTLSPKAQDSLRARAGILLAQRDSLGKILVSRQIQLMATEPVGQYWMYELDHLAKAVSRGFYREFRPDIQRLFDGLPPEVKDSPEGRDPGIEPMSPTLQADALSSELPRKGDNPTLKCSALPGECPASSSQF